MSTVQSKLTALETRELLESTRQDAIALAQPHVFDLDIEMMATGRQSKSVTVTTEMLLCIHWFSAYIDKLALEGDEQTREKLLNVSFRIEVGPNSYSSVICLKSSFLINLNSHLLFSKVMRMNVGYQLQDGQTDAFVFKKHVSEPYSAYRLIAMVPFVLKELGVFEDKPQFAGMEELMRKVLQAKDDTQRAKLVYQFLEKDKWFTTLADAAAQKKNQFISDAASFMVTDNVIAEINRVENLRKQCEQRLETARQEMIQLSKQLKMLDRDILGLLASEGKSQEKIDELSMFLKGMEKTIRITSIQSQRITFNIRTTLDDVDQDALRRYIARPDTVWGSLYKSDWGKFLIDYIFLSKEYRFMIQANWEYIPLQGVSLRCDLGTIEDDILTNYHINHYSCISGYASTLEQYNQQNDVVGALYTAVKATKNHNVLDSTVSGRWISNVLNRETGMHNVLVADRKGNPYTVLELKSKYDNERKGSVSNEGNSEAEQLRADDDLYVVHEEDELLF